MKSVMSLALVGTILSASAMIMLADSASAKPWSRRVNARQCKQQDRIGNGVSNGSLTARESARIERQQQALSNQEQRMRESGNGLSAREHRRLKREQNQLSHNIYRQKHDAQDMH